MAGFRRVMLLAHGQWLKQTTPFGNANQRRVRDPVRVWDLVYGDDMASGLEVHGLGLGLGLVHGELGFMPMAMDDE